MEWQPIETAPTPACEMSWQCHHKKEIEMTNTRTVCYVRELEVGTPIFNPEMTPKMVTMSFRRTTVVTIKINGKELYPLNYHVDCDGIGPAVYRISKNGGYSIYTDRRMNHDDLNEEMTLSASIRYIFLVNSGDTYQVIASVGPLSWTESEYIPEVSE